MDRRRDQVTINNDLLVHAIENFRNIQGFIQTPEGTPYMICACLNNRQPLLPSFITESLVYPQCVIRTTTTVPMREVVWRGHEVIGSLGFCEHCSTVFYDNKRVVRNCY